MLCTSTFSSVKDLVNRRSFDIFRSKDGAVPLIHTGAALPWRKLLGKALDMDGGDGAPFGYSFADSINNGNSWSFLNGPSLLDEQETHALDDFFDNPDEFGPAVRNPGPMNLGNPNDLFGDLDDWNQYLSPTNIQSTSNIGPVHTTTPTTAADAFQQNVTSFGIPALPQQPPVTNNQDLDAALALLGANTNHPQPYAEDPFFTNHQPTGHLSNHHARHSISGPITGQLPFASTATSTLAPELGARPSTQSNGSGSRPQTFRFGSDASFHPSAGFVAPPNTNTHVDVQKRLVNDMNAMGRRESAPSTRASSPVAHHKRLRSFPEPRESDAESSQEADSDDEEEAQPLPKKRRRNMKLDMPSPPPLKTMPRRKSISQPKKRSRNSLSGDMGKAGKQKENLTEEQKRSNHIQSEQKRRNIIKDAYNDLNKLVPNLREGGFSKSQALVEAANFLEEIVAGNKRLREILNANRLDD
ncbi:MAG: hypothetical protein M1821_003916 [Bathelium mastoideum]|nr:MAG: hypothetical protein M1821_003916 [Bathelium mastoideum]